MQNNKIGFCHQFPVWHLMNPVHCIVEKKEKSARGMYEREAITKLLEIHFV